MDGARGDVRVVRGEVVPADVEGSHPAPHHSKSRRSSRISRHESLRKGSNWFMDKYLNRS